MFLVRAMGEKKKTKHSTYCLHYFIAVKKTTFVYMLVQAL